MDSIAAIEQDLANGHAPVIQLVSTNESQMEQRIHQIPVSEWDNIHVDITPLEGVISYLRNSFPIFLYKEYEDDHGNIRSELARDENGEPIICQAALERRDELIEKISTVPPLPGALEQILHHFGHDRVAEVTGRKIRVLKDPDTGNIVVSKRAGNSNLEETQAFMDGSKAILVFSNAGGTGRSYHASLNCQNQNRRVHYLLESGWRAEEAVQGIGRTHRTHQASPPIFRLVSTNVHGERRFKASIEKRIAALGALTKGQSQAGGQGIFQDTGNLESIYAKKALNHFFTNLYHGRISSCSLQEFQEHTGLRLTTDEGTLKEELPSIQRFLNRLLALRINMQNAIFQEFDAFHQGVIEDAIASGRYETGFEVLKGERFRLISQEVIYTHPTTGSQTISSEVEQTQRTQTLSLSDALNIKDFHNGRFLINRQSGKAAIGHMTTAVIGKDGSLLPRIALQRPTRQERILENKYAQSSWEEVTRSEWQQSWLQEISEASPFETSRIFAISGLLLPIWSGLKDTNPKVYRINLDSGERLLGRIVASDEMARAADAIGLKSKVSLTPSEIYRAVLHEEHSIELGSGLSFRSCTVQNKRRIEVAGYIGQVLPQLKAAGCFTELIQGRTRAFISTDEAHAIATIEQVQKLFK